MAGVTLRDVDVTLSKNADLTATGVTGLTVEGVKVNGLAVPTTGPTPAAR